MKKWIGATDPQDSADIPFNDKIKDAQALMRDYLTFYEGNLFMYSATNSYKSNETNKIISLVFKCRRNRNGL